MDNGGTFIGGDIGLNDKAILTLNDLQEQDFYSLFLHKIEKEMESTAKRRSRCLF